MVDFVLLSILLFTIFVSLFSFYSQRKIHKEIKQQTKTLTMLQKSIELYNQQDQGRLEKESKEYVFIKCIEVINAVRKQTKSLHPRIIETTHTNDRISNEILVTAFNPEQIVLLQEFFAVYETYLEDYWLTKNKQIKVVFKDNEVIEIKEASDSLVIRLEKLFTALQSRK